MSEQCVPKKLKQVNCCHYCARYNPDEECDGDTPLKKEEILR